MRDFAVKVSLFLVIALGVAFFPMMKNTYNSGDLFGKPKKELAHQWNNAPSKELQPFENKIKWFLSVSVNDPEADANLEKRKKFFTDNGWSEYLRYIRKHEEVMSNEQPERKSAYYAGVISFEDNTQEYLNLDGKRKFIANGSFIYGSSDHYIEKRKFTVRVVYDEHNEEKLDTLIIDGWEVGIGDYKMWDFDDDLPDMIR